MYLKKYLNLFKKDLLISKSMIFLLIYFFAFALLYPKLYGESAKSSLYLFITILTLMETLSFCNQQVFNSEKSHGNDLMMTTTYTRKDIIISRYLFIYLLPAIFMALEFVLSAIIYPGVNGNFFMSLNYMFSIFIGSAILLPLTFILKNTVYFLIGMLCLFPIYILDIFLLSIDNLINPMWLCLLMFLVAAMLSYFSFKLSEKIYLNKSL